MKRYHGPFNRVTKNDVTAESVPLTGLIRYYVGLPNAYTQEIPGSVPASTEYYDTLLTPKFNKLVGEGWIIQNPFTKVRTTFSAAPGSYSELMTAGTSPQVNHQYTNLCPMFQQPTGYYKLALGPAMPSMRESAKSEALSRVFAKANTGNADLLVDLVQYRSMVNMFTKAVKTLIALVRTPGAFLDLVKAHLRGNERYVRIPPNGKKVPVTSLEGLWCELRFGWRPLLGTIEGIADAFNRYDLDQAKRTTYRATEEVNFKDEVVKTDRLTWTYGCLVLTDVPVRKHTETVSYESNFRAGVLIEDSTSMYRALGLDERAIPIALWDCIPYSFIVDRFINVGNWLRSLRPIPTKEFGGAWVAERFTVVHRLRTEFLSYSGFCGSGTTFRSYTRTPGYCEGSAQIEGYVRSIHEHAPLLPTLRHDWSELKNTYNLIDVAMLAIQRLRPDTNKRRN